MTTGDDQFSGWTEKQLQTISQSQACSKKTSWSLFHGLLPVWTTTTFWISMKPLNLRSILSKSMRCPKTATSAGSIGQHNRSNISSWPCLTVHHTTKVSKVEGIGLWHFASFIIFTWPLTNWLPQESGQPFLGKMLPQPARCRKCFPRVYRIMKQIFFFLQQE